MEQNSDVRRLARAARQGDATAVDALVRALQPSVVRAVRLVVGSGSSVAEEACQDALVDIVRGISGLTSPESAEAWAMRIAMRRAIRAARWNAVRARFAGQGESDVALAPETHTSERMLEIHEAFRALPLRLRAVAVMRLYLDLSEEQTAAALDCSPGTVKSRLHAARKRLQRSLGDAESAPLSQVETARRPA